ERKLKEKYGGAIPGKKAVLSHRLKERKYFDSGDYAMSKAGKGGAETSVGTSHPTPDTIPHSHPQAASAAT
ncbi:camp-regulated phosphoprotein/endosulfine conserved region-domain-containing protein, partial [Blastocladiella britannica]